ALVHEASHQNLPIRVAGSGHSFTPVVATSGLLLSLKTMEGLVSADVDRKRVVVRAGTRIGDIGRALKRIGLSLPNQGDIDTQAIAGALSTGTHGTGVGLGCLSRRYPACSTSTSASRRAASPRQRDRRQRLAAPAASARTPVGSPSGAATQATSATPDSARTIPSARPNGAGLAPAPIRAIQLPVKLGVTRPPT